MVHATLVTDRLVETVLSLTISEHNGLLFNGVYKSDFVNPLLLG